MDADKVFKELKSILAKYADRLAVVHDTDLNYYLNTIPSDRINKPEFFAAVQQKKSYVAFHLMPVYYYPELLENISAELKNKMQGKSCFNFKSTNEILFEELASLIKNSFEQYASKKTGLPISKINNS